MLKMNVKKDLIGKIFLDLGKISKEQLDEALKIQEKENKKRLLGEILIEKGWITEDDVMNAYALQFGMKYIKLDLIDISPILLDKFPVEFVCKYEFLPIKEDLNRIIIAVSDIDNYIPLQDLELLFGKKIETVLSKKEDIVNLICEYYKITLNEYHKYHSQHFKKNHEILSMVESIKSEEENINIIVVNDKMKTIIQELEKVAKSDATILFYGETGTGKEILASFVHYNSYRKNGPFIKVNCAALPETLVESELFGYEKGAFTGAYNRKYGRFEMANNGTIFLDEIGELSLATQAKFLRILQDGEFERLGGNTTIKVNTRVIAATNRNLQEEVEKGNFRKDLFFRLNVISFYIPPLRARKDEIPYFVEFFIKKYNKKHNKKIKYVSPKVLDLLQNYDWPGNIRELENCIERAVVLSEGDKILVEHLPYYLKPLEKQIKYGGIHFSEINMNSPEAVNSSNTEINNLNIKELEKNMIIEVLKKCNYNKTKAAQILGIHRNSLIRKIKKYKLE